MIQRLQSVFLLSIIAALLTTTLVPIWTKIDTATTYLINTWCFQAVNAAGEPMNRVLFPYALVGLLSFMAVGMATYELFRYDNRGLQLKLGMLNTLVMIVLLGLTLYLARQQEAQLLPAVPGKYQPGFFLLIVAMISNLLANHFIRKDEKLVRSADRMR